MQRALELKAASAGGRAKAKFMGEARTLNDAMRRYMDEISPTKRGGDWEAIRINAITTKHPAWPGERRMADLDEQDLIGWRDVRAKQVKDATLLREMALVSAVLDTARRDWGWIDRNPLTDVRKPSTPPHRERVITKGEIRAMLRMLRWSRNRQHDQSQRKVIAHCFIAALQTGMRAGEICNLRWEDVKANYCVLRAGETKSGRGREVPLTPSAKRNIEAMRGRDEERVFAVDAASLDAQFRYYRGKAKLKGFTFHDSRHTAATRMAQKIHVLDLCKVFGWTDPKRAMIYYNPTGADIAARLST